MLRALRLTPFGQRPKKEHTRGSRLSRTILPASLCCEGRTTQRAGRVVPGRDCPETRSRHGNAPRPATWTLKREGLPRFARELDKCGSLRQQDCMYPLPPGTNKGNRCQLGDADVQGFLFTVLTERGKTQGLP